MITPEGVEVLTAAPGWVLPTKKADVIEAETGGGKKKQKGRR